MSIAPEVLELEELARQRAVPLPKALRLAGVASSTYWRWRHDGKWPSTKTVGKIRAAIAELAEAA
jgi:predicted DNA-binding transcriptional regulator AlpA